jgi:hypothetical protein
MIVDLPVDYTPEPVSTAAVNWLEIRRARTAALDRLDTAKKGVDNAKVSGKHLKMQAMMADPEGAIERAKSREPDEHDVAIGAAKQELKRAQWDFDASVDAVSNGYGDLIGTVFTNREKWAARLRKEAEKALIDVAGLTRSIEAPLAKLEDAMGLLEMLEKVDADIEEGITPAIQSRAGSELRTPIAGAVLNLHQAAGRAQARLRDV